MGKLRGRYTVVSGDRVFCHAGGNIISLAAENGDFIWKSDAVSVSDPVHIGSRLFACDSAGNFSCLNAQTGERLFTSRLSDIDYMYLSMPFVSGNAFSSVLEKSWPSISMTETYCGVTKQRVNCAPSSLIRCIWMGTCTPDVLTAISIVLLRINRYQ
jgi:outer membrane protein assembly factor BamB